jgi:hypothetical protein
MSASPGKANAEASNVLQLAPHGGSDIHPGNASVSWKVPALECRGATSAIGLTPLGRRPLMADCVEEVGFGAIGMAIA